MKRSELSDKEIVELLRQMPKIEDHRHPRDIYQNLPKKKRKTLPWLLPGLAAAAALFLFFILVPILMDGNQFSFDKSTEEKTSEIAMQKDAGANKDNGFAGTEKIQLMNESGGKTAVYEDEAGGGMVLTYWIPDRNAQILVPVSTVVQDTQGKDWLTLFNEKMASLKEAEWGLQDYYPLNATITMDEKTAALNVNVPADHRYGMGSTGEGIFIRALNRNTASNSSTKKIQLFTEGKLGIEFGNFGPLNELEVIPEQNHAYFFYFPEGSDMPLLVPTDDTFVDIKTAFAEMEKDPPEELGLKRSLLPALQIVEMSMTDKTLYISIKADESFASDPLAASSFEAILLTAKEFGAEKVVINNPPFNNIGPFDLTVENKVPVAPNRKDF